MRRVVQVAATRCFACLQSFKAAHERAFQAVPISLVQGHVFSALSSALSFSSLLSLTPSPYFSKKDLGVGLLLTHSMLIVLLIVHSLSSKDMVQFWGILQQKRQ